MRDIVVIAHNLRSCHNVGSLLRTAEGLGVTKVYLTGYSPYPQSSPDTRLPYIAAKLTKQINKTSLGAELTLAWEHVEDIAVVIAKLRHEGYTIAAVEQHKAAVQLPKFDPPEKVVLIVGREVEGIEQDVLRDCDIILEIPMFGAKESFNVIQATAMALYHCRFKDSSPDHRQT